MRLLARVPRQVWFAALGVALLVALAWVAATSGPFAPVRVTVAQVVSGEVHPALFGIGTVEAQHRDQLASQYQAAIIVVTHDEKIIPTFKRIYHIRDGRTIEEAGAGLRTP